MEDAMQIDEAELRRLVFVAQQRRERYLGMPIPAVREDGADDPATEAQYDRLHDANTAGLDAFARLLDYLEDCLDMRSEFRKH